MYVCHGATPLPCLLVIYGQFDWEVLSDEHRRIAGEGNPHGHWAQCDPVYMLVYIVYVIVCVLVSS